MLLRAVWAKHRIVHSISFKSIDLFIYVSCQNASFILLPISCIILLYSMAFIFGFETINLSICVPIGHITSSSNTSKLL